MNKELIAPCGMNCGVCRAFLRDKNPCHGCRSADLNEPKTRVNCKIRNCEKRKSDFCSPECGEFPCESLKHLDKRYCEKYDMSELKNLETIREKGIGNFLAEQEKKYCKHGCTRCVHDGKFYEKPLTDSE
jgi:hypothetical protein